MVSHHCTVIVHGGRILLIEARNGVVVEPRSPGDVRWCVGNVRCCVGRDGFVLRWERDSLDVAVSGGGDERRGVKELVFV